MQIINYIGIPYLDAGRSLNGGDCWFLICYIYQQEYGITLPSFATVSFYRTGKEELGKTIEEAMSQWEEVTEEAAQEGDVIVFKVAGHCAHVGLFLEKDKMLHLLHGCDSVVDTYSGPMWRKRIAGFYRYRRD